MDILKTFRFKHCAYSYTYVFHSHADALTADNLRIVWVTKGSFEDALDARKIDWEYDMSDMIGA